MTDTQLKIALAKMLPSDIEHCASGLRWRNKEVPMALGVHVLDTELLHICWLVERTLERGNDAGAECYRYAAELYRVVEQESQPCMASWQQRTIALAKVKGIEV